MIFFWQGKIKFVHLFHKLSISSVTFKDSFHSLSLEALSCQFPEEWRINLLMYLSKEFRNMCSFSLGNSITLIIIYDMIQYRITSISIVLKDSFLLKMANDFIPILVSNALFYSNEISPSGFILWLRYWNEDTVKSSQCATSDLSSNLALKH